MHAVDEVCRRSTPRVAAAFSLCASSIPLWLFSLIDRNVTHVDSFWSLGFMLCACIYRCKENQRLSAERVIRSSFFSRSALVTLLTSAWALRLSLHLTVRNHGLGEDYRYRALRKSIGNTFWYKSFYYVFLFQAVLCFIISQPLAATIYGSSLPSLPAYAPQSRDDQIQQARKYDLSHDFFKRTTKLNFLEPKVVAFIS